MLRTTFLAALSTAAAFDPSQIVDTVQLPGQNFTQYLCNNSKPLDACTNDLSKCYASTHIQGTCLQTGHGSSSATAVCGLGNIKYKIYVGSHNCTGKAVESTQILDVCEEGGGGKFFVKLECQTGGK